MPVGEVEAEEVEPVEGVEAEVEVAGGQFLLIRSSVEATKVTTTAITTVTMTMPRRQCRRWRSPVNLDPLSVNVWLPLQLRSLQPLRLKSFLSHNISLVRSSANVLPRPRPLLRLL